jgi:NDP-sugar pyrophosphorylase family protein
MILAAGKGTRLKDITKTTPKCLVEVAGRPMLAHVADQLRAAGVQEVVINLHHLAEVVRERVVREAGFGLKVEFSLERELLGTGGGLRRVKQFFSGPEPFLLLNADIYSEFPLKSLVESHQGPGALGTLLTMQREDTSYLLFDRERVLKGYEIVGKRLERVDAEVTGQGLTRGAFCGVQMLSPRIFDFMEGFPEEFSLIDAYLKAARAGEKIVAQDIGNEFWIDMGTPEKLESLGRHLQR